MTAMASGGADMAASGDRLLMEALALWRAAGRVRRADDAPRTARATTGLATAVLVDGLGSGQQDVPATPPGGLWVRSIPRPGELRVRAVPPPADERRVS